MPDTPPVPRPEVVAWLRQMAERYEADAAFAGRLNYTVAATEDARDAALYRAALRDVEAMGALEDGHTLHRSVDILYIVDAYQVEFTDRDGQQLLSRAERPDLADAILAAAAPPGAEP